MKAVKSFFDRAAWKERIVIIFPTILLIIIGFGIALHFVQPAPPTILTITAGNEGGAYYSFAQRYREILARDGVTLNIQSSAGSLENLNRLIDSQLKIEVGFIQGGIESPIETKLVSLGALYYEPVWIFYRGAAELTRISELSGKRIAVGRPGSGTQVLAMQLLQAHGITSATASLESLPEVTTIDNLLKGELDAAWFVGAPDSPIISRLLQAPEVRVMSIVNAEAIVRHYPFLTVLTVPRGVLDLALDIPSHDLTVLATTANLIAQRDLHPALAYLLLAAATETHNISGILYKHGEFPKPTTAGFPISEEAQRYFRSGTPLLRRYLPFWLANFIERMLVLLIPLFALLIPALKTIPALIQWRVKSRLFRWYSALKDLEREVNDTQDAQRASEFYARLAVIQQGVERTPVPTVYSDSLYHLKGHLELTRREIDRILNLSSVIK